MLPLPSPSPHHDQRTLFRLRQAIKPYFLLGLPDSWGWCPLMDTDGTIYGLVHPGHLAVELHHDGEMDGWETLETLALDDAAERVLGVPAVFAGRGWTIEPNLGLQTAPEGDTFQLLTTFHAVGFHHLKGELRWVLDLDAPPVCCHCQHH